MAALESQEARILYIAAYEAKRTGKTHLAQSLRLQAVGKEKSWCAEQGISYESYCNKFKPYLCN